MAQSMSLVLTHLLDIEQTSGIWLEDVYEELRAKRKQ